MRSKQMNALLLAVAVVLDAGILFYMPGSWMRLAFGLWLLAAIIIFASQLELGGLIGTLGRSSPRPRRFPMLRASVGDLLAEVRRLNWLVVDMDRGFRDRETVAADIQMTERRMEELLREIWKNAGKSTDGPDTPVETPPSGPPATAVGEPPRGTEAE